MIRKRQIKQIQDEDYIFYHSGLPNCVCQMLIAIVFSQRLVSSSKTIRPDIRWGVRYVGQCEMMRSAVCSIAPLSQFREWSEILFMYQRTKASNARMPVVEFDSRCSEQTHSYRSGADSGYESIDC